MLDNHDLLPIFLDVHAQFVWAKGYLQAKGLLSWLDDLPLEYRQTLPDGTRLLAVHASPGNDDGTGIHAELSDEMLYQMVKDAHADLIFVGHYHRAYERTVKGIHCVNVASVSNPSPQFNERRAHYTILEANETGYKVTSHYVEYDYQAMLQAVRESRHPAADFICSFWGNEDYSDS